MGMTILVLQALTVQCRAPGRAAKQKTAAHHVGTGPDHVADALKAEHGVENIKRNGGHAVHRVGRTRCLE